MSVLFLIGSFLLATLAARVVRAATGLWLPGWIGGLSLLAIFGLFFVLAIAIGAPTWWENAFFIVVGLHVGTFMTLARLRFAGAWWQIWR